MIDYNVVQRMMESHDPIWSALDLVYNSVEGTPREKSIEVAELVSKFVLFKLITEHHDKHDVAGMRHLAVKLISRFNEHYPFNVVICLNNVTRGLRTYSAVHSPASHLADVDDFLTILLRGNKADLTDGVESIKDKITNKVKSMFHIFDKGKKGEKGKVDKTDEKLNLKREGEDDNKLGSAKEDDAVVDEGQQSSPQYQPEGGETDVEHNPRVCAHEVAWEVLSNVWKRG